jgi:antitoxin CptB
MTANSLPPSRLGWACRRGMLELDVLLGNFLKERYPVLSPLEKIQFETLLHLEDQDLFLFLSGTKKAEEPALQSMINLIKQHAYTRHKSG